MKPNSLHGLYLQQLRDLYDAEQQLIEALPRIADAATSPDLRSAFEEHWKITKTHARRLEAIFARLGETTKAEKCKGMEGLIKEGAGVIKQDVDDDVKDAALIAAAQRAEHYEIAGYGTLRTYANLLGDSAATALLQQTLDEEKEADHRLTSIAQHVNIEAGDEMPPKAETESGPQKKSAA